MNILMGIAIGRVTASLGGGGGGGGRGGLYDFI